MLSDAARDGGSESFPKSPRSTLLSARSPQTAGAEGGITRDLSAFTQLASLTCGQVAQVCITKPLAGATLILKPRPPPHYKVDNCQLQVGSKPPRASLVCQGAEALAHKMPTFPSQKKIVAIRAPQRKGNIAEPKERNGG